MQYVHCRRPSKSNIILLIFFWSSPVLSYHDEYIIIIYNYMGTVYKIIYSIYIYSVTAVLTI